MKTQEGVVSPAMEGGKKFKYRLGYDSVKKIHDLGLNNKNLFLALADIHYRLLWALRPHNHPQDMSIRVV